MQKNQAQMQKKSKKMQRTRKTRNRPLFTGIYFDKGRLFCYTVS